MDHLGPPQTGLLCITNAYTSIHSPPMAEINAVRVMHHARFSLTSPFVPLLPINAILINAGSTARAVAFLLGVETKAKARDQETPDYRETPVHVVPLRPYADPKISVVVPAMNEARNLEVVLPALPDGVEVILVDGHSVDDTKSVVERVRPDARFVQQTRRGKGNALAVGFAAATGDIIVMFDADGSADPAEIVRYVEMLKSGADFAKGSRVIQGGGSSDITWLRNWGNRALTLLTNIAFGTRYTDLCYGYNAFWKDILPHIDLPSPVDESREMLWGDGFEIETLINCRLAVAQLSVVEVPSNEQLRLFGDSNLDAMRDGLRVLKTLITEWTRARSIRTQDRLPRTDSHQESEEYYGQPVSERALETESAHCSTGTIAAGRATTDEEPLAPSHRLLDQSA